MDVIADSLHLKDQPRPPRDPSAVQGGDLTHLPNGLISLDLGLCTNRLGPPPAAIRAVHDFLDDHPDRLMPPAYEAPQPPYRAERRYLQAFATWLGVDERHMLAGRGVTEFLVILGRLLRLCRVAVVTPEYTETMRIFSYAHFEHPDNPAQDTPTARLNRVHRALDSHDYVILSNPSNPLGHYIPREQLLEACAQHPYSVLIVDEEYVAFQGEGLSLAGAEAANLVVLQSTGKTFGITATRAGMLWTRHTRLHQAVDGELLSWPLSLLDIILATAALEDSTWLPPVLEQINSDGRQMERLLIDCFGPAVVPSGIHYRFVHLPDPYPVLEHLHTHGISARLFTAAPRGCVPGLRLAAPNTTEEFGQLHAALASLPAAARSGAVAPHRPPYAGKWVLEPLPRGVM
ncbi:aminotransferase class I/II-fold pyridoxal phosphate-dependent enzyme [Streptomyces sp. NPDC001165]|uniref:aminotransferase class I/II-fold pyridoxal phosphate-dependent enzyme n=1 Tax=Streptomyces sp. NPDC001165 TaxID=3364546 RepID=UPI0036AA099F